KTDDPPQGAELRREGTAEAVTPAQPAALHGRLLNVSRMATIGEMAAGGAHELNQPLTAIAVYAQACDRLLAHTVTGPTDVRGALRQITAQTARAAEILRRLRALARSQQGEHLPANLNAVVSELHDLIQTDAHVHGVRLSLQLAAQLPEVLVDTGE